MRLVSKTVCLLVFVCLLDIHANAAVVSVDYDGSVLPNAGSPAMSFVQFGGTTAVVNNGVFTMTTAPSRGIWFGNGNFIGQPAGFSIAPNSTGSYLKLQMKLADNSSEWSMYIYDGTSQASFSFDHDGVIFNTADESFDISMNLTDEFHTFEIEMKDGWVSYRIDNTVHAYQQDAILSTTNPLMVIGDGSGSTPTGVGSMMVDHFNYQGEAGAIIPEPASGLILLACAGAFYRRRQTA